MRWLTSSAKPHETTTLAPTHIHAAKGRGTVSKASMRAGIETTMTWAAKPTATARCTAGFGGGRRSV